MAILMRFPGFKRKAFTVSYDDGTVYDKRLLEIMSKNGIKGTLNVNSSPIDKGENHLTSEDLAGISENGVAEIAVHGYRHLSLSAVDFGAATRDVIKDREKLESILGKIVRGMAYANGSYNDDVVKILENCGIEYARTTISTEKFNMPEDWLRLPATCHHNNPRLMELARDFVEREEMRYFWRNAPMLFYVWGHSSEFQRDKNWEVFEELCEYVGGREDVWYATNGEIYEYDMAYRALRHASDQRIIHNPSALDVYLRVDSRDVLVPAGKTVKIGRF